MVKKEPRENSLLQCMFIIKFKSFFAICCDQKKQKRIDHNLNQEFNLKIIWCLFKEKNDRNGKEIEQTW